MLLLKDINKIPLPSGTHFVASMVKQRNRDADSEMDCKLFNLNCNNNNEKTEYTNSMRDKKKGKKEYPKQYNYLLRRV